MLCDDDVITVLDVFQIGIQLYCWSLGAYHCENLVSGAISVDDLPHYIKNRKKEQWTNVSVNSNWVHPPGQPPGISSKRLPRGSGFDF